MYQLGEKVWVQKYRWLDGTVTWNVISRHAKIFDGYDSREKAEEVAKQVAEELGHMYDPLIEERMEA